MTRHPSKETQIKNLTKELNLAKGRIQDDRARIDDLEKRLAEAVKKRDCWVCLNPHCPKCHSSQTLWRVSTHDARCKDCGKVF